MTKTAENKRWWTRRALTGGLAASLLSLALGMGSVSAAETSLSHYGYGAALVTDDVVVKQQRLADTFTDLKLIPVKLDISSVVWRPTP